MGRVRFGVVVFPGSNCDHDAYHVLGHVLGQDVQFLWHKDSGLSGIDVVILPGGFSYGDYLRSGAIARFSPIMKSVIAFAESGGIVIGICNGFQILCEAGLLPGALLRNEQLTFVCRNIHIRVEQTTSMFTRSLPAGEVLTIPVAHGEGNYYADPATLQALEKDGRVLFRYCLPDGSVVPSANPNGSLNNIAGIVNERGNVMGMMPHPERVSEAILGCTDGRGIFESVISTSAVLSPRAI
jgi:phosphoribosylformylglycinamidine synthase subunit PurQ / glutaminase